MPEDKSSEITRRRLIKQAPAAVLAASAASSLVASAAAKDVAPRTDRPLPRRVLGRTKLEVTSMTLGTVPCGMSKAVSPVQVAEIVNTALDLGVNYVDSAPGYGNAEEGIGLALGKRRKKIILGTKLFTDSLVKAEEMFAGSLKNMKTDYVDLLYFHQLGARDIAKSRKSDGVFTYILKQKAAGKCRFVGVSSHDRPGRVAEFLETGLVDVLMVPVNFADEYTYGYEKDVLPIARKHNVGIVAMKVFGGPALKKTGKWSWRWEDHNNKANVGSENVEMAIRYGLGVPGVSTVNLGVHNAEQVRQNVKHVMNYKPLSDAERAKLAKLGKQLSAKWGPQYGPVEEKKKTDA
jgi:predicted aldo/keto reductase-like oxidoreductase